MYFYSVFLNSCSHLSVLSWPWPENSTQVGMKEACTVFVPLSLLSQGILEILRNVSLLFILPSLKYFIFLRAVFKETPEGTSLR